MIYRRVLRYYRPFLGPTLRGSRSSRSSGSGSILLKPWPFKFIVDQILPSDSAISARPMPIGDSYIPLLCLALVGLQLAVGTDQPRSPITSS